MHFEHMHVKKVKISIISVIKMNDRKATTTYYNLQDSKKNIDLLK